MIRTTVTWAAVAALGVAFWHATAPVPRAVQPGAASAAQPPAALPTRAAPKPIRTHPVASPAAALPSLPAARGAQAAARDAAAKPPRGGVAPFGQRPAPAAADGWVASTAPSGRRPRDAPRARDRALRDLARIRGMAAPTEAAGEDLGEAFVAALLRDPGLAADASGTFGDAAIAELIERGDDESFALLAGALVDPRTDLDSKQEVLARIEELIVEERELVALLRRVADDDGQPDELRVQAVSRLGDFGPSFVSAYRDHANDAIASEVDLLDRLALHAAQQR